MWLYLFAKKSEKARKKGEGSSLSLQRLLLPTLLLRGRLNCVTWHHPTQMTYDNATIKPILARPPGGAARFASYSLEPLYNFYTLVVSKGGHTNHDIIAPLCHLKSRKLLCKTMSKWCVVMCSTRRENDFFFSLLASSFYLVNKECSGTKNVLLVPTSSVPWKRSV